MTLYIDLKNTDIPWETLQNSLFVFESYGENKKNSDQSRHLIDIIMMLAYSHISEIADDDLFRKSANIFMNSFVNEFSYINYTLNTECLPNITRKQVIKLTQFIGEHYSEKISISDFSDHQHFNKTHMAYFIKSSLNHSFNEILNYIRCCKAEHLMLTTDYSNAHISEICGFSDAKYFYAKFKQWYGRTPNEHKKEYNDYMGNPDDFFVKEKTEIADFITNYYCHHHYLQTADLLP